MWVCRIRPSTAPRPPTPYGESTRSPTCSRSARAWAMPGTADDLRHRWLGFGEHQGAVRARQHRRCEFSPAFSGQSRNNGWYAGGGFEYMVHKGPLVDVILGAEYQHFDVRSNSAFTDNTIVGSPNTFDQDAKGDIVRARLTIKTQGYGLLLEITDRSRDQPHNGPGQPPGPFSLRHSRTNRDTPHRSRPGQQHPSEHDPESSRLQTRSCKQADARTSSLPHKGIAI